jgi:hypothetical protein
VHVTPEAPLLLEVAPPLEPPTAPLLLELLATVPPLLELPLTAPPPPPLKGGSVLFAPSASLDSPASEALSSLPPHAETPATAMATPSNVNTR